MVLTFFGSCLSKSQNIQITVSYLPYPINYLWAQSISLYTETFMETNYLLEQGLLRDPKELGVDGAGEVSAPIRSCSSENIKTSVCCFQKSTEVGV